VSEHAKLLSLLRATRDALRRYKSQHQVTVRINGEMRTLYSAQPKQDHLHGCPAPNILYGGAAGGSKSHGMRWDAIIKCLRVRGLKVLFLRRSFPELESTHLLKLQAELPREVAKYNGSMHRLTFGATGSIIQFGHVRDLKALGSYLSTEWDVIYVDEASTFHPHMLAMLQTRARTTLAGVVPQFILGSNPGGDSHVWMFERFITKQPTLSEGEEYSADDYAFIPALVTDNAYITDAYITRLLGLPKAERDAYLYGRWDTFAGQFFREWNPELHTVAADAVELPEWMEREGGMDWGYDPDPFVVLVAAFDGYGRPWVYREIAGERCTPREVAELIDSACPEGRARGFLIRGDTQMWVTSPESGVSIADQINDRLAELGSQITLVKANKDRRNGWMRVRSFLDPRRPSPEGGAPGPWLRVVREADGLELGCPYLIRALPAQRFDERPTKTGDMAPNAHDHPVDALRYLLMGREPLSVIPLDERPMVPDHQRTHQRNKQLLDRLTRMAALEDDAAREHSVVVEDLANGDADANPFAEGDTIADAWA
jgi:phage terminase large subunit